MASINKERLAWKIAIMMKWDKYHPVNSEKIYLISDKKATGIVYDMETGSINKAKMRDSGELVVLGKLPTKRSNGGYVSFYIKEIGVTMLEHNLAALACGYYSGLDVEHIMVIDINHKNGNKKDNRIKNLEISSRSENIRHGYLLKELRRLGVETDGLEFEEGRKSISVLKRILQGMNKMVTV